MATFLGDPTRSITFVALQSSSMELTIYLYQNLQTECCRQWVGGILILNREQYLHWVILILNTEQYKHFDWFTSSIKNGESTMYKCCILLSGQVYCQVKWRTDKTPYSLWLTTTVRGYIWHSWELLKVTHMRSRAWSQGDDFFINSVRKHAHRSTQLVQKETAPTVTENRNYIHLPFLWYLR